MLYLKEHKKVALHVACGDITNAKIKVCKSQESVIELDLKFEVVKFENNEQKIAKDVKKLQTFFGNKVEIE